MSDMDILKKSMKSLEKISRKMGKRTLKKEWAEERVNLIAEKHVLKSELEAKTKECEKLRHVVEALIHSFTDSGMPNLADSCQRQLDQIDKE